MSKSNKPLVSLANYTEAREKYNPLKIGLTIEVLWIAESPPAGGGYFYFETASGRNNLFRETMKALRWWDETIAMHAGLDKTSYLKRFQEAGYFLIDLSLTPVNKLGSKRDAALQKNIESVFKEIETLNPSKILVIKANVFKHLFPRIQASKFNHALLNKELIPFPNYGWQPMYRKKIRELIQPKGDASAQTFIGN